MSYNEIPNIVVDSVVLPNKSFSNIKVIDTANSLSLDGFKRVFLRDTLPKKAKLSECGILNLDSSGYGTHWVIWFKKERISYISIVMDCNLLES